MSLLKRYSKRYRDIADYEQLPNEVFMSLHKRCERLGKRYVWVCLKHAAYKLYVKQCGRVSRLCELRPELLGNPQIERMHGVYLRHRCKCRDAMQRWRDRHPITAAIQRKLSMRRTRERGGETYKAKQNAYYKLYYLNVLKPRRQRERLYSGQPTLFRGVV